MDFFYLWTDGKDYLKKFTSASDIDLDIQKFCIEIPVSVEKLLKVIILNFIDLYNTYVSKMTHLAMFRIYCTYKSVGMNSISQYPIGRGC